MNNNALTKKSRNAGIEFLRIIAMILIVAHHFSVHGGFSYDDVTFNSVWIELLSIGGKLGVNIFLLITGYFSINSVFSSKKAIKLYLEVIFYSLILVASLLLFGKLEFRLKLIPQAFFPLFFGKGYWFIGVYLLFYCVMPFINRGINKTNKRQHLLILLILACIWVVFPLSSHIISFNSYYAFSNIGWFVFIYLIGAYLRKYPPVLFEKRAISIILTVFSWIVFIVAVILNETHLSLVDENTYIGKMLIIVLKVFSNDSLNGLMPVIISILMFISFYSLRIKGNRLLFSIALSTFGIYLIHDNPFFSKVLWLDMIKCNDPSHAQHLIVFSLISIIIVFICCSIIDIVRGKTVEQLLFSTKMMTKITTKIDSFINVK